MCSPSVPVVRVVPIETRGRDWTLIHEAKRSLKPLRTPQIAGLLDI